MIPFYELILTELGGVECISLVDRPAMESTWIKLSKQEVKFQTINKEKRILFGAILIPNKPIYRMSEDGQEFYIVFSKNTIEKVRNKYFATQKNLEFNAQHEAHIKVNGYMVESFIKDSSRGMNPPQQFMDLPDGTWFGSIKVEDDLIWNRFIKNNVFTGFSIEGDFKTQPILDMAILDKFHTYLDNINKKKVTLYNENHDEETGRFAPEDGGGSSGATKPPTNPIKDMEYDLPASWNSDYKGVGKTNEDKTLHSYTRNGYSVNKLIMTGQLNGMDAKYADNLDRALKTLPDYKGDVHRVLKDNGGKRLAEFTKNVGGTIEWKGFTSTSSDKSAIDRFANVNDITEKVVFKIKSKTGKDVSHLSDVKDEKEVVFNRGTKFKITGINKGVVSLEEI